MIDSLEIIILLFELVFFAVISIIIAEMFVKVSMNYVSLIMGAVLGLLPVTTYDIRSFNPEVFMLLIVAPLLFFEGQATFLNVVGKRVKQIFQVTVIMVLLCAIVAGFSSYAIGKIGLPLAFILAAISTPTDATATQSVTEGLKIPRREGFFLKMESLFNDASGIILLNMAVLWYINGRINYRETLTDFILSAGGGIVISFIIAWIIVLFRQALLRSSYNSVNAQVIIYLMTPFIIYYLAEEFHVSGIIAVVCAGLVHNAETQRSRLANAQMVYMGTNLVSIITELFNSIVFVILGMMLVNIIKDESITYNSWIWITLGAILYLSNVIVRYIYGRIKFKMDNRAGWIFSLGGVHGAVTLSLAFTVAKTSVNSQDFSLVVMSESVLIILSMIVPTIIFRFILEKDVSDEDGEKELDELREEMIQQAIATVQKMYLAKNVKQSVIFDLKSQNQNTRTRDFVKEWRNAVRHPQYTEAEKEMERRAFINAFYQERQYLDMISQKEARYEKYVYHLYSEILLAESIVLNSEFVEE